jgi:hypothetical protein
MRRRHAVCRKRFIQVRSAGADETFDTSDDLVVDAELGTLPPSPLSAP